MTEYTLAEIRNGSGFSKNAKFCEVTGAASADEYNGWTNRETWAVAMHLGNDQAWDSDARERVAAAFAASRVRAQAFEFTWTVQNGLQAGGEALRDMVDEYIDAARDHDRQLRPFRDLVDSMRTEVGSLWRVDWPAVAEAFAPEEPEA